jgi:hypothetical protein
MQRSFADGSSGGPHDDNEMDFDNDEHGAVVEDGHDGVFLMGVEAHARDDDQEISDLEQDQPSDGKNPYANWDFSFSARPALQTSVVSTGQRFTAPSAKAPGERVGQGNLGQGRPLTVSAPRSGTANASVRNESIGATSASRRLDALLQKNLGGGVSQQAAPDVRPDSSSARRTHEARRQEVKETRPIQTKAGAGLATFTEKRPTMAAQGEQNPRVAADLVVDGSSSNISRAGMAAQARQRETSMRGIAGGVGKARTLDHEDRSLKRGRSSAGGGASFDEETEVYSHDQLTQLGLSVWLDQENNQILKRQEGPDNYIFRIKFETPFLKFLFDENVLDEQTVPLNWQNYTPFLKNCAKQVESHFIAFVFPIDTVSKFASSAGVLLKEDVVAMYSRTAVAHRVITLLVFILGFIGIRFQHAGSETALLEEQFTLDDEALFREKLADIHWIMRVSRILRFTKIMLPRTAVKMHTFLMSLVYYEGINENGIIRITSKSFQCWEDAVFTRSELSL